LLHSRVAVWLAFALVHGWTMLLGVVLIPARAFWDLDLYRFWMWQGLEQGVWQGIDVAWVYPPGALLPMLVAAAGGTGDGSGYATVWCLAVTLLDAVAVFALLHTPAWAGLRTTRRATTAGAWWWIAFLALLGPVGMGRLDAVLAPIVVVALVLGLRHPWLSSAVLTVAAWIKVAPGALLAPLFLAARRPWRDVVAPAVAVSLAVALLAARLGGLPHIASFLTEQDQRGLQVEAVGATPWLVASLWSDSVVITFNDVIVTYELTGPGTQAVADTIGALFFLALAATVAFLWWRRHALGARLWREPRVGAELLVRGALLVSAVLIVFNKVGSPQYIGWLAPPVAVALALRLPRWRTTALLVAGIAGATQVLFPWAYDGMLLGHPLNTLVLVARNVLLVLLLAHTVRELLRQPADGSADGEDGGSDEAAATKASSAAREVPSSIAVDGSDSSSFHATDASSGPASAR
jgi:hypothetical protein